MDSITDKRKGEFAKLIGDSYFKNKDSNKIVEYLCKRKVHVSTKSACSPTTIASSTTMPKVIINANKEIILSLRVL